jgi:hypothetical protein
MVMQLWGQEVPQGPEALAGVDFVMQEALPLRIIEWGTGEISLYLAVWAAILQAELLTVLYDEDKALEELFAKVSCLPVRLEHGRPESDVFRLGGGWTIPRVKTLWVLSRFDDEEMLVAVETQAKRGDVVLIGSTNIEVKIPNAFKLYNQHIAELWGFPWLALERV